MVVVKKQRIDKYYNLAKEKGYRSRASFKLLELNKKFNFLKGCKVAVDLCAAPGGWLQILMQEMPLDRKIIGIDLDPIAKLGDCSLFQSDITSVECRRELLYQLDNQKADIFVHDGAPNFGMDPSKDIFVQNDLVLSAMKLATEFLKPGGTFVTKIFRSENFTKIVNLCQPLFEIVNVTKPLSSRNESAEIFAVCRRFKNPEDIDPRLFDSAYMFKTEDEEEVDQYRSINLSEWICSSNSIELLKNSGKIICDFECDKMDAEALECFKDLNLLGPKEIRHLMRMRKKFINSLKKGVPANIPEEIKEKLISRFKLVDKDAILEESIEEDSTDTLKQIEEELARIDKKKQLTGFYNDRVFHMDEIYGEVDKEQKNVYTGMEVGEVKVEKPEKEIIADDSSCSTDFELNSSELECLAMLKENPEQFKDGTVDKYLIDSDDNMLPGEERGSKFAIPKPNKLGKKELEAMGRKKMRALRRSNKLMKDIVIEDEEEEAIVYKKIFKNQLRKQQQKRRLVFANIRGGQAKLPKGQGRCIRLDSRMKHDLYLEKNKKSRKSKNRSKK